VDIADIGARAPVSGDMLARLHHRERNLCGFCNAPGFFESRHSARLVFVF